MRVVLVLVILGAAALMLIAWIARLQRKSKAIEKTIDYSKMKEWKDDD